MERKIDEVFNYKHGRKTIKLQVKEVIGKNEEGESLICVGCFLEKICEKADFKQLGKCYDREDNKEVFFKKV